MDVLLTAATIGVMVFGFFLMTRVDRFLSDGGFEAGAERGDKSVVLVLAPDAILNALEADGKELFSYKKIVEPLVPADTKTTAVLALSDSDLDNLLLCSEARHLHPNAFIVAKCNDTLYLNIFQSVGINQVLSGSFSVGMILAALQGGA